MKKITITNVEKATDVGQDFSKYTAFELEGPEEMEASDGYHTFGELYEHRIVLWKALISYQEDLNEEFGTNDRNRVWKSKLHHDGTSFDGWFISGIGLEKGEQITYHLPIKEWESTRGCELEKAPEWDGHTSKDVLERLKKFFPPQS